MYFTIVESDGLTASIRIPISYSNRPSHYRPLCQTTAPFR